MSQFDPTKHAWSGLERAVRRVFPERQFLLRSGDNVHWVQFSTRRQLVAAFCVVAVAAWGLYTTEQFVSHRQIIRAKDHYISNAYAAYDTLVGQVDQYRTNFESLATELDSNHTSILELATENEQLRKEMAQGAKKGPTLEIFTYETMVEKDPIMAHHTGFTHLAFEVEDVEKTLKKALTKGGSPLGQVTRKEVEGVGLLTFVYFRDPEGNIIEIQSWN